MLFLIALALILQIGLNDGTDDRIIGGEPASISDFPYQISLRRTYNNVHFCGGTLITSNHVLTAAHCMFYVWGGRLPPIVVYVVAGQSGLNLSSQSVTRNVSNILIHSDYNKSTMDNDLAILFLSKPFKLVERVIDTIHLAADFTVNAVCVVSGWGVQEFESEVVSETLLATEVTILDKKLCIELYQNDTITDNMMCAGSADGKHDACQGDSGGPLTCNGLLTGVVSTGKGCGDPNFPGIYADIVNLSQWIQNITGPTENKLTEFEESEHVSARPNKLKQMLTSWTNSLKAMYNRGVLRGTNCILGVLSFLLSIVKLLKN